MLIDYKIVLSIIILLCVLFLYFHYNRPDYLSKLKADLFQRSKQKFIEGFTSSPDLIKNGSFKHGLDINESPEKKGINSIIKLANPLSPNSEYVLEQSPKSVFYMFKVPVTKGHKYTLSYWIGKSSNWNGKDKNFNLLDGKKIHSTDGTLVKSKKVGTIEWKQYKYNLKAESTELEIYLGYKSEATRGNRYFTDVKLTPEISGDQSGFPKSIRNSLQTYVNFQDSKSFTPTSLVIKDLSGNGHNIKVKTKLTQNTDGSIPLNQVLTGTTDKMNNITVALSFEGIVNDVDSSINLFTCGRFQINTNNDFTNITIKSADQEKTYFGVLDGRNTVVTTYNGKEVIIYVNGKNIFKESLENSSLSESYSIGPGNLDLYSFAILNKVLTASQVSTLTKYLSGFKAKSEGVLGKMMAEDIPNVKKPDLEGFRGDISVDNLLGTEDNAFIRDHDNSSQRGINGSWHERGNKHELSDCLEDYHKEIERHGGEKDGINIFDIRSCRKACDVEGMKTHPFCKTIDGINREKRCKDDNCPTAYLSGEDYMIYIRPGSKYEKKIGRSGSFNYGANRRRAREIYLHNFDGCPVPDVLTPHGYVPNMDECPFLVDEMNPCKEDACRSANWRERDVRKQNLSKKCRRSISNYCDKFKYKDDACSCWRPRNKDNPKCVELRDYVDNLEDKCRIDVFNIEDHPDMKNYVRKDEIPCWGCKL
jgi:hypothetical protein